MVGSKKIDQCIVAGCVNCKHEGGFIGDICIPCYHYITTGKVGATTSFLGQLSKSQPTALAKTVSGYHLFVTADDFHSWLDKNKGDWHKLEWIDDRVTWHGGK